MENQLTAHIFRAWFLIIIFCLPAFGGTAEVNDTTKILIIMQKEKLLVKVRNACLEDVLKKISNACDIEIKGLSNRKKELITFISGNESIECEMKRLLRYLNIRNFAFEYKNEKLKSIAVFPASEVKSPSLPIETDKQQTKGNRQTRAVRVEAVIENSQAETFDIRIGDLVVSYDNKRILNSKQLMELVQSKSEWERVDLIMVRGNSPILITVNGSQIGIRIKTVKIPSKVLELYDSLH